MSYRETYIYINEIKLYPMNYTIKCSPSV